MTVRSDMSFGPESKDCEYRPNMAYERFVLAHLVLIVCATICIYTDAKSHAEAHKTKLMRMSVALSRTSCSIISSISISKQLSG
jgi:hypothetical protein